MYSVNENYVMRNIENQIFLINMKEGQAHLLNTVATLIFEYIKECGDLDDGLKKTKQYFSDINPRIIEDDYYKLTSELIEKGILIVVG